jgi:hypothetical protein
LIFVAIAENQIPVGHYDTVALPFTLKMYIKAKEELGKVKYFTIAKI